MFTVKTKDGETVEIDPLLEAAGGAAIDAYCEASPSARAAQLEQLRAAEVARLAVQEAAWRAAHTPVESTEEPAVARRRRDRATPSQE